MVGNRNFKLEICKHRIIHVRGGTVTKIQHLISFIFFGWGAATVKATRAGIEISYEHPLSILCHFSLIIYDSKFSVVTSAPFMLTKRLD